MDDHVFVGSQSFEDAFPEVENVTLTVTEDKTNKGSHATRSFSKETLPGDRVPCPDDKCQNGGYDVSSKLCEMIRSREERKKLLVMCRGSEGSPRTRTSQGCRNCAEIEVHVVYKSKP
jgi:hypothetical protein